MPSRRRWTRPIVAILAASVLAVLANLALCLLFAYRSAAYGNRTWSHLVGAGDRLAQATRYDSLGKTIQFWKPIYPPDIAEFRAKGTFEGGPVTLGPEQPDVWSAFWDDTALDRARHARNPFGDHRHDIAVGWPWRAFACLHGREDKNPASPLIHGGIPLAPVIYSRATYSFGEIRAIPLRPIWRGIALDTLILWPFCLAAVLLTRSYLRPAIAAARAAHANAPARPPASARRRIARASGFLLLGLLTAGIVTLVLPFALRARIVSYGASDRLDAGVQADLWWRRWHTPLSAEESADQSDAAADAMRRALHRLHYSGDPARQSRSPGPNLGMPEYFANRRTFDALETGQPFTALWGAQWVIGPSGRTNTGIREIPVQAGPLAFFSRGLREFPTHIVWLGWIANSAFYALVWFLLFRTVVPLCHGVRAATRLRRNHCPQCNYDLCATPPASPCPECGHLTSAGR